MNLKNIGTYLKSSLVKNASSGSSSTNGNHPNETIKSINLKTSASSASSYNPRHSANLNGANHTNVSAADNMTSTNRTKQTSNLVHRHSNPLSSYTNTNVLSNNHHHHHSGKNRLHAVGDSTTNALPRIRINS